jgi:hypothetical protein
MKDIFQCFIHIDLSNAPPPHDTRSCWGVDLQTQTSWDKNVLAGTMMGLPSKKQVILI